MKTTWFWYLKINNWFEIRTEVLSSPTLSTCVDLEALDQQVRPSVAAIPNLHSSKPLCSPICTNCTSRLTVRLSNWRRNAQRAMIPAPSCGAPANGCVSRACVGADLAAHRWTLRQHRLHSSHPCFQLAWKSSAVLRGHESRVETILLPRC